MMVKVCGITRREDADAAVDAGASAIGFIFYPKSPRYVTPERAAALGARLDVWKVGVFVDETAAAVESIARTAKLDVVQLYGGETPRSVRVWRAFRMVAGEPVAYDDAPEAVLLDGPATGKPFDWNGARLSGQKVIVAGGLDASNVAEAIRVAEPWGVDASSGLESAPGLKDHERVRQFVRAALAASKVTAS
jgi:phosphoribosylanthranilate isomerase